MIKKNWRTLLVALGGVLAFVTLLVAPAARADDQSFLDSLNGYVPIKSATGAVGVGHKICALMYQYPSYSAQQVTDALWKQPEVREVLTYNQINIVVLSAVLELCPSNVTNGPISLRKV